MALQLGLQLGNCRWHGSMHPVHRKELLDEEWSTSKVEKVSIHLL